ncbi:MAG: hypothetical protein QOG00_252 [Pyrinomonadaceae bacterium]|nr:hypothetical protein [Pyrinomonadaceae bacterium]
MDAIYQTLIGGGLALIGSLSGTYFSLRYQRRLERINLKSAFYGEVKALLTIVEMRGYDPNLAALLDRVKSTGDDEVLAFNATRKYFQVYEQNVSKIGLLPAPLPEKLALFYSLGTALLEDMDALQSLKKGEVTHEQLVAMMTEQLVVIRAAVNTGYAVLSLINPDVHHTPSSLKLSIGIKSSEIEPASPDR